MCVIVCLRQNYVKNFKRRQDIDKKCLEIKKYGVTRLIKEFQTRNGVSVVLGTFWSDCEQRGPLNEHPVMDARRALLRTLKLWGTWYRARRINPRHTAPLDRSHESSEYLRQIIGYEFFCSLLL